MGRQGPTVEVSGVKVRHSEMRVLKLLVKGKANKQIAYELGMHESCANQHLRSLSKRLGFNNRVQIAVWAVKNGIE